MKLFCKHDWIEVARNDELISVLYLSTGEIGWEKTDRDVVRYQCRKCLKLKTERMNKIMF